MEKLPVYQENLIKLSKNFIPELSELVDKSPRTNLAFCKTLKNEQNLSIQYKDGQKEFFHAKEGALEEAIENVSSLNLSKTEVLYVYGIGLGYHYQAAKEWLKENPNRYLAFIEDNLETLHCLLETKNGERILEDPQVIIHYIDEKKDLVDQLAPLPWFFSLLENEISSLPYYQWKKRKKFREIHYILSSRSARLNAILQENMNFGSSFFHNFYRNFLIIEKSFQGEKLFGKYKDVPAIICGSGPSLQKNFETLRSLGKQALIISGGSALTALSFQGFLPHLTAAFGPNILQKDRLKNHLAFETPFIYQNRLFYQVSWEIHGPRLLINKPESYPIVDWLEKKLEISEEGSTKGGVSISNFCISLAKNLGCNPIIFVGYDMAYTNDSWYAEGIMSSKEEKKSKAPTNLKWKEIIESKDIYGNPIQTTRNWIAESEWIENFSKINKDITIVNASEGGIGIKGIPNIPLEGLIKKYLKKKMDIKSRIHADIFQHSFPNITKNKVLEYLGEMYDSLERCIQHCNAILNTILESLNKLEKTNALPEELDSPESIHLKKSLEEEIAYHYVLSPLEEVFEILQKRNLYRIQRDPSSSQTKCMFQIMRLRSENLVFIKRAAEVNQEIIEESLEDFEERGEDISVFFQEPKNE